MTTVEGLRGELPLVAAGVALGQGALLLDGLIAEGVEGVEGLETGLPTVGVGVLEAGIPDEGVETGLPDDPGVVGHGVALEGLSAVCSGVLYGSGEQGSSESSDP